MSDELAEINGVKPNVVLADGEERTARSQTSNSEYKVKRTTDHYFCTCPAWRNQKAVPVNARSCKHLQSVLGEKYEAERLKLKNPDGPPPKGAPKPRKPAKRKREEDDEGENADEDRDENQKGKPTSRGKPRSKPTSTRKTGGKAEEEEIEEEQPATSKKPASRGKPASKSKKGASSRPPPSKDSPPPRPTAGIKRAKEDEDEEMQEVTEDEGEEDEGDEGDEKPDGNESPGNGSDNDDELAEINGIKPKVYLKDGEDTEVNSLTSSSVYKVKRTFDHYYCTCPAWRNQSSAPVNARTCKHLKSLLGDKYEDARIKLKNPDGPAPKASKGKGKRKKGDDDDDDDSKPSKKARKGDGDDNSKVQVSVLLANSWDVDKGPDPTGWWISEKLDGVRTYYDGKRMYSRLGNPFTPPQWFLDKLPKNVTLDGELFGGRGEFQSTVSIVKTINSPHWKGINFHVFDIPSSGTEPFEKRMSLLDELFGEGGSHASDKVVVVEQEKAKNKQHVLDKLKEVESLGGEGLMLRKPQSQYEGHRSSTLLKIKSFYDAEALVTGYKPGKGRNQGVTGALKCKMASGKTFDVGTGLSDKQRKNPPKIGSIIVYRFQELTRDGVPRFPAYIGEAADKTEPKDAEVPEHRKGGAKPKTGE